MLSGLYECLCRCGWSKKDVRELDAREGMEFHRAEHPGHFPSAVEQLPKGIVPGDRVRFPFDAARGSSHLEEQAKVRLAIRVAYPGADVDATLTVTMFEPYTSNALRLDGAPFVALPRQLALAWRNDTERRVGLEAWYARGKAAKAAGGAR